MYQDFKQHLELAVKVSSGFKVSEKQLQETYDVLSGEYIPYRERNQFRQWLRKFMRSQNLYELKKAIQILQDNYPHVFTRVPYLLYRYL